VTAIAAAGVVLPAAAARAQDQAANGNADANADATVAARLADLRLESRDVDRGAGLVLFGWGASSVVAGTTLAVVGAARDSTFTLFTGLTHATWGLANALLALTLFDLSGATRADIARSRPLRGDALRDSRDEAIASAYGSALTFAVNAGLDVAYVATGLLLFAFARAQSDADVRDGLGAFGLASAIQGGVLLPFDLTGWIRGVLRAHERRAVRSR